MSLEGPAVRLSVYIGEDDQHHGHPLYQEIVHRAHAAGLAGASVFRGIEGYGRSHHVHTTRLLSLSQNLPLAVIIVDAAERISGFLPQVTEIVSRGLVTTDEVQVVHWVGRE